MTDKTVKESEVKLVKEEEKAEIKKEEIQSLAPIAYLFGQTEDEIEREFRDFKAKKLFQRLEYDLTGVVSDEELSRKLEEISSYGFGSVVILPQYVSRTVAKLKGKTKIIVAVNFPYGEEIPFTTVKCAKKAVAKGADVLLVPVGLTLVKRGAWEVLTKQFAKLKKVAKNAQVYAVMESSELTAEERKKIAEKMASVGVSALRSATGVRCGDDFSSAENLKLCAKSLKTIGYCSDNDFDKELAILSVNDRLATPYAKDFAERVKIALQKPVLGI